MMSAAKKGLTRPACLLWMACLTLLIVALPACSATAQENTPESRPTALVRLRLPLTGNADAAFRGVALRVKAQLLAQENDSGQRPVMVIEFAPDDETFGVGCDFERALSLARFLTSNELSAVQTVAFVPETLKGHGVLVALACEEIALSPTAELGQAGLDEPADRPTDPTVLAGYQQIASARLTVPPAIAIGMVNPAVEVLQVKTEKGTIEFIFAEELPDLEARLTIVDQKVLFPAGALGSVTGREARDMALSKYRVIDRESLARALRVPATALAEAGAAISDWRPIVYDIEGPIDQRTISYVRRLVREDEVRRGKANFVVLRIDSIGGDWSDAQQLAGIVADLKNTGQDTRVVTYVPRRAGGAAALVALAGEQLVMQPDAILGGISEAESPLDEASLESLREAITGPLAKASDRSGSLLMAFADPALKVYRYNNRKTGEVRLLDEESVAKLEDADDWQQNEEITTEGDVLTLTADQAQTFGIASHVVSNYDELMQVYALLEEPRVVRTNWSLELADALRSPPMQVLLLVIAFVGVYFELNTPGMGIGGFIAAVAILLFFWSKALDGTVEWLEILLFFGGIIALLLELFVLPGVGIFGIGGALMIVASIVLAGQRTLIPTNDREWANLEQSLGVLIFTGVGIVVATLLLRRYLPHIPYLNAVILAPPAPDEAAEIGNREYVADYSHLLGHRGTAVTPLLPSGKVDIDGELLDVVTGGEAIDRGTTIEIVEVQGHRVTVRAV